MSLLNTAERKQSRALAHVFFPKLGEDQMLTFSSICDDFVKAEGFTKKECSSDAEAKAYAAANLADLSLSMGR